MSKSEENKRAYDRRRLRELALKSGIRTYIEAREGDTKTHPNLRNLIRARNATRREHINERFPATVEIPIRQWIDTPQDRAEAAAILAPKPANQ